MERATERRFDDSDNEEFNKETNAMKNLLYKFSRVDHVLKNPALTAALMNFIFNKSQDYYSLLYYFAIQKYRRLNEVQSGMLNYNHINMEIFTVFIHTNSILHIDVPSPESIAQIEKNISSKECFVYFQEISKYIVDGLISNYLTQLREAIQLGLETFCYTNGLYENINRMKELSILDTLHKAIHSSLIRKEKSRCLRFSKQDVKKIQLLSDFQIRAIRTAMNTQYEYFIFRKKFFYLTKHPSIVIPVETFMSYSPARLISKQRIKGHCFEEDSLPEVTWCFVCELIVWGSYPNCWYCKNCLKAIHSECKESVNNCQINAKQNKTVEEFPHETEKERQEIIDEGLTVLIDPTNPSPNEDRHPPDNDDKQNPLANGKPKPPKKPSLTKMQELKGQYPDRFNFETPFKNPVKYTKSMNSNTNSKRVDVDIVTRSKSARSQSPETFFNKEISRLQTKSTSDDSGLAASVEPLTTSQMDTDDEMQILETFEPEVELKRFSKFVPKSEDNTDADYVRLLVLMEFHHNTRFTRMTLKRFKYLLVDPWLLMNDYLNLFDVLSLHCIEKLYKLIGSLVEVIDSCETDCTYDTTLAEKIITWITANDDNNFRCWLQLSTDLCCTNILQSVKLSWTEHKQLCPRLNELFSKKINRLVIIDQLSNMRPLLFNLPMIVKKIVKDLGKFAQFKDEAKKWDQINDKLSSLPQLIDERCMPVVQLINNGIIVNSALKYKRNQKIFKAKQEMESYINNFPNTVFKNRFIDFQFIKISNLSQSLYNDLRTIQSSIFVREEVDAAAICYDKEMILLQKENDKYILKRFKSLGNGKLFPMIQFENSHVTKQTIKENEQFLHRLTVLVIHQAILLQILFREEKARDMWFHHITNICTNRKTSSSSISSTPTDNDEYFGINNALSRHNSESNNSSEYVNNILPSVDLIAHEPSINEPPGQILKSAKYVYPTSSKSMLNQLIQRDAIINQLAKLRSVGKQMDLPNKTNEQAAMESDSSDESTVDDEDIDYNDEHRSENVRKYIEDKLSEALNKIQQNSKTLSPDKVPSLK